MPLPNPFSPKFPPFVKSSSQANQNNNNFNRNNLFPTNAPPNQYAYSNNFIPSYNPLLPPPPLPPNPDNFYQNNYQQNQSNYQQNSRSSNQNSSRQATRNKARFIRHRKNKNKSQQNKNNQTQSDSESPEEDPVPRKYGFRKRPDLHPATIECSYCDVSFRSEAELQDHRRYDHKPCPYDECNFSANEAAIQEHIQKRHLKPGGLVKVLDLSTPEQIEKWREERRKRYPTTANVLLRQQIQEEKQKRGEKLEDSKARFGDQKLNDYLKSAMERGSPPKKKKLDQRQRKALMSENEKKLDVEKRRFEKRIEKRQRLRKGQKERKQLKEAEEKLRTEGKDPSSSAVSGTKTLPKFTGTKHMDYNENVNEKKINSALSLVFDYGTDSEDEEEAELREKKRLANEFIDKLLSVEGGAKEEEIAENQKDDNATTKELYDPFDESEDDADKASNVKLEPKLEKVEPKLEEVEPKLEEEEQLDESFEEPEEVATQREDTQPHLDKIPNKRKHQAGSSKGAKKPRTAIDYSKLRNVKSGNPFLEKLLHREIVHERNYLLQCVNYVVQNNFFGVGQPAEEIKSEMEVKLEEK